MTMQNIFLKISTTLVWLAALALLPHCLSQTDTISTGLVEIPPTPTALSTPTAQPTPATLPTTPTAQPAPTTLPSPAPPNTGNVTGALSSFPYEQVDAFNVNGLEKLSGMVFYPPQKTLFAVIDDGRIVEIESNGRFIQNKQVRKKADFEGITYNPMTKMLYVVVEGEEVMLEINPATLEIQQDIPINRNFNNSVLISSKGDGIEGITFVPTDNPQKGIFYLVNQSKNLEGADPSIVIEAEVDFAANPPQANIIRYFSVGVTDLSGLEYDSSSSHLFVISDKNDLLLEVSLTGQILKAHTLPGKDQEGIAFDDDGFLYIAQDAKDGPLKFRPLYTAGANRD